MARVISDTPAVNGTENETHARAFWPLTLGCMGVVYGDIGTSPLYAFRVALEAAGGLQGDLSRGTVIGVLSLILWALFLVVTAKYVLILLRADNKGEGGTLSLMALAQRAMKSSKAKYVLLVLGMIAASLFYGDALLTPAISVLSAVEGLEVAAPQLDTYVVPLTVIILIALFAIQSRGTAMVASYFGPIMTIWFIALAGIGLMHIADDPGVLNAFNPAYGIAFVIKNPLIGLATLGAVFLAVTGAEALYADLGHFGRKPIQTAWLFFVLPALAINYLGQGSLVLSDPSAVANPFYRMVPQWALYPMIGLATAATVIASQAVITGAFSLTNQAVQLGILPRLQIKRTSETQAGQIYIPRVRGLLLVGTLLLVAMFRSSEGLASAYGVAVAGTMLVDGIMAFMVIWRVWKWALWGALALMVPFMLIDFTFFGANLLKVPQGGWVPLLIGTCLLVVMLTWRKGAAILAAKTRQARNAGGRSDQIAGKKPAASRAWHCGVPHGRSGKRANGAAPQPQALQGAAREQRDPDHRHRRRATGLHRRSGRDGASRRQLHAGDLAFRLHGDAQHSTRPCHRPKARLDLRHHVDLVLPVAAIGPARRPVGHADLAGQALHLPHPEFR